MSLLQMSFAGGVMILAVIVIRALAINLLPKKTFGALWGMAVVRLMVPFSVPSAFSVYTLLGGNASAMDTAQTPQAVPMLTIGTTGRPGSASDAVSVWTVIWAAGVLVCAVFFAAAYWKCRQEFQASLPVENDFIGNWLNAHRQRRKISVRQSGRFSAPLTYGLFRPVILMPASTKWENTESLQYDKIRYELAAVICRHFLMLL